MKRIIIIYYYIWYGIMYINNHHKLFKTKLGIAILVVLNLYSTTVYAEQVDEQLPVLEAIQIGVATDLYNTEQSQSYSAQKSNTSTKLALDVRQIPQTVKVFTRQYLDDRNITSSQQLFENITGVSTNRWDERIFATARGFSVDYHLFDGLPTTMSLTEGDLDLGMFDRIDVVKGANGLSTGSGNPAMGINYVRKRATARQLLGKANVDIGSWQKYGVSLDVGNKLNTDGSLRGRVYLKHGKEKSYMDFFRRQRNVIYGALDYDLNNQTSLSAGVGYQQLKRDGIRWGGLPAFYDDNTRTHFKRSLTVSSDWTYWDIDTITAFTELKHRFINNVALQLSYNYRQDQKDSALLYVSGKVDKATNSITRTADISTYSSDELNKVHNIDAFVNIPLNLFNRQHEIVLGASWNKNQVVHSYWGNAWNKNFTISEGKIDFNNMNTTLASPMIRPNENMPNETTQMSSYLSGKFHLLEPLTMVAGIRVTNWKYRADDNKGNREFNNQLTPYIGFIYDFLPQHNIYASYTNIFKPQNNKDINGVYLDPINGKQYEVGLKSSWFNGHLNSSLSTFRIQQDNVAERIDNVFVTSSTEQAYRMIKGVKSKGVELELNGEINDKLSINFGIAHFSAKDAKGHKVDTAQARTTSNLFMKYQAERWDAGVGLNYRSKIYTGSGATFIKEKPLWLANAMLNYQVTPKLTTQLNINNLFDKKYYSSIGDNRMTYGEPINVVLGLTYKF